MKTAEEILAKNLNWEAFGAGQVITHTDKLLKAMEEYAAQFKPTPQKYDKVSVNNLNIRQDQQAQETLKTRKIW